MRVLFHTILKWRLYRTKMCDMVRVERESIMFAHVWFSAPHFRPTSKVKIHILPGCTALMYHESRQKSTISTARATSISQKESEKSARNLFINSLCTVAFGWSLTMTVWKIFIEPAIKSLDYFLTFSASSTALLHCYLHSQGSLVFTIKMTFQIRFSVTLEEILYSRRILPPNVIWSIVHLYLFFYFFKFPFF